MTSENIEMLIKKFSQHKSPNPGGFTTSEVFQIFKEDLLAILFRLFQEN